MSDFFRPKLQAVDALAPYRLRTTWSTGEVLEVDVESVLRGIPALANLLDPQIFAKAHLAEWGQGIEWFDAELGADNVYAWAKEQAEVSHQMFGTWMHRNGLSLNTAAEAFGILPPHGELLPHGAEGHPTGDLARVPGLGSDPDEAQDAANGQGIRAGACLNSVWINRPCAT